MDKLTFNSNSHNPRLIRVRLMAKLVVIFICLTLFGLRIGSSLASKAPAAQKAESLILTFPFLGAQCLIVLIEYFLYRKIGLKILKYSKFFDIVFILVFTTEWVVGMHVQVNGIQGNEVRFVAVSRAVGFASFSWRALLPILITQQWQFKVIPATAAYTYLMCFIIVNQIGQVFILVLGIVFQMTYIILIYYFVHKINFTLIIGNVQQEQWLQLNDFILNNIPENIAILDSNGNANFKSVNFKKLMQRNNQTQDINKFLRSIKQIQQIQLEKETEGDSDYGQVIF